MKVCPICETNSDDAVTFCPKDGSPFVGDVIKKYRIIAPIGKGGYGAVFRVQHAISRDICALKMLLGTAPGRAILDEAKVVSQFQHANIVRVLDIDFTSDDRPFLIMEYVDGQASDN